MVNCEADRCTNESVAQVASEYGNGSQSTCQFCLPCAREFVMDVLDPKPHGWLRLMRPDKITLTRNPDPDYPEVIHD